MADALKLLFVPFTALNPVQLVKVFAFLLHRIWVDNLSDIHPAGRETTNCVLIAQNQCADISLGDVCSERNFLSLRKPRCSTPAKCSDPGRIQRNSARSMCNLGRMLVGPRCTGFGTGDLAFCWFFVAPSRDKRLHSCTLWKGYLGTRYSLYKL
jgi:hypothetical protein